MNYENQNSGNGNRPEERPERKTEQEGSGYSPQREQQQQTDSGSDTSFSEGTDVTPPNEKEFPSEGPSRGDFQPQHHNRSTGRMVGHEPGTEGI